MLTFYTIIALGPIRDIIPSDSDPLAPSWPWSLIPYAALLMAFGLTLILPVILLSVAPAKAVSRRLIFLAIGLILLEHIPLDLNPGDSLSGLVERVYRH